MTRVLHLIDQASPQACPTTLALLRLTVQQLPEVEHHVVALGGAPLAEACDAAGLIAERIGVPYGSALTALPSLRGRLRGQSFEIVHGWSPAAAAMGRLLRPRARNLLTLTQAVTDRQAREIRRALGCRARQLSAVVVLSAAGREALGAVGVPADRVHVVPPAVDAALLDGACRDACRRSWGVDDATRVLALLGDPPSAADALRADLGVGLAYETVPGTVDPRPGVRLLRHPDQHRRAQSRRMMDNYGVGAIVGQEAGLATPWQVLPACDGVLALGACGGGLSLRWAMAAGLPIIAEKHPVQDEWLVPDVTALLWDRDQIKRLAHCVHQVLRGGAELAAMGAAARSAAKQQAEPAVYGRAMRAVYAGDRPGEVCR